MRKKVEIGAKPGAPSPAQSADQWVSSHSAPAGEPKSEEEAMKRLTIDVSASLHRKIKMGCAARGVKMADEIRELLEGHFNGEGES